MPEGTPEHLELQQLGASVGAQWTFLSDPGRIIQNDLDIQEYTDPDHLWHDLREVSREVRPDWDLSKPGLREAWNAGDWSLFHGWDRRSREQPDSGPQQLVTA